MRSRQGWSLSWAVALIFMALTAVVVLVLHQVAIRAVREASLRSALGGTLLGWGVALVLFAGIAGAWAGRWLGAPLRRLSRALRKRASGDPAYPLPTSFLREARTLAVTANRVSSEFRRRAAGLERQREELSLVVDSVSEGLLRTDARGRLTFLNPAGQALLGLRPEVLGQPVATLIRDLELRDLVARAVRGETLDGIEVSAGERRVLVSAQPLPSSQPGEPGAAGAVLALADLTALRRLEGVRRDFVANVSHELKTPLTSIRGYLETMLQDDLPADMRRQFLEVAGRNAEQLQHIVEELLDLSRVESGGWQPEPQAFNAAELVHEVWLGFRERAEQLHVAFQPPTIAELVQADPGALRHILDNLLDNALRHTPAGGRIEVRLTRLADSPEHGRDWVVFEVVDTGSGIPHDALPRIFERFYRVDPARSRAAGGTGLGLSIVKHLVESMGGDVVAESELGHGTTIRFRLPAAS